MTLGKQTCASFSLAQSHQSPQESRALTPCYQSCTYADLKHMGVLERSGPPQPLPAGVIKSSSLNLMGFTDRVSPQFPQMTPDSDSLLYSHCLDKSTKITSFVLHGGKNVILVLDTKMRKCRLNFHLKARIYLYTIPLNAL